jgi:hypothetical protein
MTRLAVILLMSLAISAPALSATAPAPKKPADANAPRPSAISATVTLSASKVRTGDHYSAWLTLTNTGGTDLSKPQIAEWVSPGSSVERLSWTGPDGPKTCDVARLRSAAPVTSDSEIHTDLSSCPLLAETLVPGQSISLRADLKANDSTESSSLYTVIEWPTVQGLSSQGIAVGKIEIQAPLIAFLTRVYGFLKDFALPIVLAGLAFLFNRWDKSKEGKRQAQADRLADEAKIASDQRALVAQTWQKRLGVIHELTTQYYLPTTSAVYSMLYFDALRLKAAETSTPETSANEAVYAKREFFSLILAVKRMYYIYEKVGGLFLKDLMGERLVGQSWNSFMKLYTEGFNNDQYRLITRMTNHIELKESGDSFLTRLDSKTAKGHPTKVAADLNKGLDWFKRWLASAEYKKGILRVEAFRCVFVYELNRPFEYWYGGLEGLQFKNDDVKKALSEILCEFDDSDAKKKASEAALKLYLEKACKPIFLSPAEPKTTAAPAP